MISSSSSYSHRGLLLTATSGHHTKSFRFVPPSPSPSRLCRWASARLLAAPSDSAAAVASSWSPIIPDDCFGGWYLAHLQGPKAECPPASFNPPTTAAPKFLIAASGFGALLTALLASVSFLHFSKRGFQLEFLPPLHFLSERFRMAEPTDSFSNDNRVVVEVGAVELKTNSVARDNIPDQANEFSTGEIRQKIIPVAADSTQLESLHILKHLNVIRGDAQPDEMCTRREYARWLVKANVLLERNAKHKIAPSMLIPGSVDSAFDDISTEDPDFIYIQAVGESGIVPSKLSGFLDARSSSNGKKFEFSPERLLSRIDLISWKAWLDHPLNIGIEEKVPYIQMLRTNLGFSDLSLVTSDASHRLFLDAIAGERSITRRIFGNIRRLQPLKPVTKAQAAVALTSGAMAEAIRIKIAEIEAKNMATMVNKKDIRSELIKKGEIQRNWEEKLCEEKNLATSIQVELSEVLDKLEKSKLTTKKGMESHLKEKTALDCQKHLLSSLKLEVDKMLENLANEKTIIISEQRTLLSLSIDLQEKLHAIRDVKSILEAKVEALRILRSWVEDGARQSEFCAKLLDNAVQRWKWDDQSLFSYDLKWSQNGDMKSWSAGKSR